MSRADDAQILRDVSARCNKDTVKLIALLDPPQLVSQSTINDSADKLLNSLDALKGIVRLMKEK